MGAPIGNKNASGRHRRKNPFKAATESLTMQNYKQSQAYKNWVKAGRPSAFNKPIRAFQGSRRISPHGYAKSIKGMTHLKYSYD